MCLCLCIICACVCVCMCVFVYVGVGVCVWVCVCVRGYRVSRSIRGCAVPFFTEGSGDARGEEPLIDARKFLSSLGRALSVNQAESGDVGDLQKERQKETER